MCVCNKWKGACLSRTDACLDFNCLIASKNSLLFEPSVLEESWVRIFKFNFFLLFFLYIHIAVAFYRPFSGVCVCVCV